MSALPAADGLAALQRNVLVAVAALVVDCARVDVDLLLGFGSVGAAIVAVLLGGHFEICVGGFVERYGLVERVRGFWSIWAAAVL